MICCIISYFILDLALTLKRGLTMHKSVRFISFSILLVFFGFQGTAVAGNHASLSEIKKELAAIQEKYESKIIWSERAENILAKINGLNPYPGAWFQHQKTRYKIWKAEISNLSGNTGEIIDEKLIIACKDKSIKILEIQKEGKNKLNIQDFLKGTKFSKGDTII